MTETQTLLGKIAALRQRLEQAQKLASEANTAAKELFGPPTAVLERRVDDGAEQDAALDGAVHAVAPQIEPPPLPRQLTMVPAACWSAAAISCPGCGRSATPSPCRSTNPAPPCCSSGPTR